MGDDKCTAKPVVINTTGFQLPRREAQKGAKTYRATVTVGPSLLKK